MRAGGVSRYQQLLHLQHWDLSELVGKARDAIMGRIEIIKQARPHENVDRLYLNLPCTFFMLKTQRYINYLQPPSANDTLNIAGCSITWEASSSGQFTMVHAVSWIYAICMGVLLLMQLPALSCSSGTLLAIPVRNAQAGTDDYLRNGKGRRHWLQWITPSYGG